jgi:hypothetical protein
MFDNRLKNFFLSKRKMKQILKAVIFETLSWVYTYGFRMCLVHCVAIFCNLPWYYSSKVSNKKLQRNAENACRNRMTCVKAALNTYVCKNLRSNFLKSSVTFDTWKLWLARHFPCAKLIKYVNVFSSAKHCIKVSHQVNWTSWKLYNFLL